MFFFVNFFVVMTFKIFQNFKFLILFRNIQAHLLTIKVKNYMIKYYLDFIFLSLNL